MVDTLEDRINMLIYMIKDLLGAFLLYEYLQYIC